MNACQQVVERTSLVCLVNSFSAGEYKEFDVRPPCFNDRLRWIRRDLWYTLISANNWVTEWSSSIYTNICIVHCVQTPYWILFVSSMGYRNPLPLSQDKSNCWFIKVLRWQSGGISSFTFTEQNERRGLKDDVDIHAQDMAFLQETDG